MPWVVWRCSWLASSAGPERAGAAGSVGGDAVRSAAAMSIAALLKGKGPNGFGYGTTAAEVVAGCDLTGQTMLVTGCASGLGLETIRALAGRGARVIATARTVDKARAASAGSGGGSKGDFLPLACDLVGAGFHPRLYRRGETGGGAARRHRVQRRDHGAADACGRPTVTSCSSSPTTSATSSW